MKKINMIMGIFWVVVAALLLCFMISKMKGGKGWLKIDSINGTYIASGNSDSTVLYREESFNANDVSFLDVNVASESVRYEKTNDDVVSIELRGDGWDEENEPKITLKGGKLSVKIPNNRKLSIKFGNRQIVVKIPEAAEKNGLKIENNAASGSVRIEGIKTEEIMINEASGSTHINECSAKKININTASGSVHINESDISGLKIDSASGSVHLSGGIEQFNVDSASGSVNIDSNVAMNRDSKVNTASGSVKIALPADSDFRFSYSTLSGSIKNDFDMSLKGKSGSSVAGSGNTKLSVETVSGSIKVLKK